MRELRRIKLEEEKAEREEQEQAFAAAMAAMEGQKELTGERLRKALLPSSIDFQTQESSKTEGQLTAWAEYRLRCLFEKYDADGSGMLDLEETRTVLQEMEEYGFRLHGSNAADVEAEKKREDAIRSGTPAGASIWIRCEGTMCANSLSLSMMMPAGKSMWRVHRGAVQYQVGNAPARSRSAAGAKVLAEGTGAAGKGALWSKRATEKHARRSSRALAEGLRLEACAKEALSTTEGESHDGQSTRTGSPASSPSSSPRSRGAPPASTSSRFGGGGVGRIRTFGETPTTGRGDYVSYYTAEFDAQRRERENR